jgi:hypothetical protein
LDVGLDGLLAFGDLGLEVFDGGLELLDGEVFIAEVALD